MIKLNKDFAKRILKKSLADCKTEAEKKEVKRIMKKHFNNQSRDKTSFQAVL